MQARATMDKSYKIFVHMIDDSEHIWAQQDVFAGGEQYPTSAWLPDEVVSTTLNVDLPQNLAGTRLTAIAGLYDSLSSARLQVVGSAPAPDYILLFTTQIIR